MRRFLEPGWERPITHCKKCGAEIYSGDVFYMDSWLCEACGDAEGEEEPATIHSTEGVIYCEQNGQYYDL